MSSVIKAGILILVLAVASLAQPSIASVVNGASYASAPKDANGNVVGNNLIPQGSIFVIFGSNLGPATLTGASSLPLGTTLPASNGTSIMVSSGGQNVNAYMIYTSAGQVAAILPSTTPVGAAQVTVTYNGHTSAPATISVVQSGLGVFTVNSQGNGPGVVQVYHGAVTAPPVMALTTSAQPGDTLVIYGTGLGPINVPDNTPPGQISVGTNVTVNVAGTVIPVAYAGRSPLFPGLDQINVTLPSSLATGCYIPAEITASGQPSNLFYLSIASGSTTCTTPFGLSSSALATLDAGGTVNIGLFQLLRAVELGVSAEGAGGLFVKANANSVFQLYNRIVVPFGGTNYPVASGSCAVIDTITPYLSPSVPQLSLIGGTELNAGPAVTVTGTGPVGATGVPRLMAGGYETVFFDVLGQGAASLSGTGGPAVGAFTAMVTLPQDLNWTNAGNLTNPPRADLTISWTGGNVNGQQLVTIFGSSVVINPSDPDKNRGKQFYCNGPASAGTFVVPGSVLSQLPSDTGLAAGEVAFGALGINTAGGASFTAPLTSGSLDVGYLAYGEAHSQTVTYQ